MPGPSKDAIYYNGVWLPANTPMRKTTYQNPDGTVTTRMVPQADKPLHVDYVNERDKKWLFAHPNAGGIAISAGDAAHALNTSQHQDSTIQRATPIQQQNYSKVNGFGRNNKVRRR